MAMRDLVTGGAACAVPGTAASSSNPFGALANAILGSSSKTQVPLDFFSFFPLSYFLPLAFVVPELVWWFIFLKSLCVCYSYSNRTGPLHCGSWFISPKISCSFGVLVGI